MVRWHEVGVLEDTTVVNGRCRIQAAPFLALKEAWTLGGGSPF